MPAAPRRPALPARAGEGEPPRRPPRRTCNSRGRGSTAGNADTAAPYLHKPRGGRGARDPRLRGGRRRRALLFVAALLRGGGGRRARGPRVHDAPRRPARGALPPGARQGPAAPQPCGPPRRGARRVPRRARFRRHGRARRRQGPAGRTRHAARRPGRAGKDAPCKDDRGHAALGDAGRARQRHERLPDGPAAGRACGRPGRGESCGGQAGVPCQPGHHRGDRGRRPGDPDRVEARRRQVPVRAGHARPVRKGPGRARRRGKGGPARGGHVQRRVVLAGAAHAGKARPAVHRRAARPGPEKAGGPTLRPAGGRVHDRGVPRGVRAAHGARGHGQPRRLYALGPHSRAAL